MIALREVWPGEATVLAELQERSSVAGFAHVFPPELYAFPREVVRARWRQTLQDSDASVLVAELDREPVGFACIRPKWMDALYVVPEQWGQGVADVLYDRALERLRAFGADRCHLWVLEENRRARRFYEKCGWRENGERRIVPFPPNPLDVGYSLQT
jgi:GNAT superfamily N-acetyltransferase